MEAIGLITSKSLEAFDKAAPLSPLLFVLGVEVMAQKVRELMQIHFNLRLTSYCIFIEFQL